MELRNAVSQMGEDMFLGLRMKSLCNLWSLEGN